jgi:hypothetical protein
MDSRSDVVTVGHAIVDVLAPTAVLAADPPETGVDGPREL